MSDFIAFKKFLVFSRIEWTYFSFDGNMQHTKAKGGYWMAKDEETEKIMAVADKYQDYFNEWRADIAIGWKGPNFFYLYSEKYKHFDVFEPFETAEELEKLIIGSMAENMEVFHAVAAEDIQSMFDQLDTENVGNYDPDFHIYKLLRQMEIMTDELERWEEMVIGTYRSFANVCKGITVTEKKHE